MSEHAHIQGIRKCIATAQAHVANLKASTKNPIKLRALNVLQDMLRHIAKAIDEIDTPKKFGIPRYKRAESKKTS